MSRSEVWEETHMMPVRVKFQRETDGSVVAQLPGYQLPILTVNGQTKFIAVALLRESMHDALGVGVPADPCPACERAGTCNTAECGRKRSSELMLLYGTDGVQVGSPQQSQPCNEGGK